MTQSIIRNVTLNYAKLAKAETNKFGKTQFDIQLEFSKDRIDEMTPFGKVRQLPNGQFAINITRPETNSKGVKNVIRVVDGNKQALTDPIGNGSTGNVIVYSYDWNVAGKSGRKSVVMAVQVTNLVPYNPDAGLDFDELAPTTTPTVEANVEDF